MKKNELKDLKSKNLIELKALLGERKKELLSLKLELSTKKLKNVRKIFLLRKDIARILTTIREKEIINA
ncbi:50S ribosomal protein L29 [Candidatus Microgenomates bacterium]|nr:50S ribosomal protein L29 [Candidatus Microgenomates bacterium]